MNNNTAAAAVLDSTGLPSSPIISPITSPSGGGGDGSNNVLPPMLAHAALSLVHRLVRSSNGAKLFTTLHGGNKILSLSSASAFAGRTFLVAGILRNVFEQPLTLRYAMEQELRIIMENLSKKYFRSLHQRHIEEHRSVSAAALKQLKERCQRIPFQTFLGVVVPLVSRDPVVFLDAANALLIMEGDPKNKNPSYVSLRASPVVPLASLMSSPSSSSSSSSSLSQGGIAPSSAVPAAASIISVTPRHAPSDSMAPSSKKRSRSASSANAKNNNKEAAVKDSSSNAKNHSHEDEGGGAEGNKQHHLATPLNHVVNALITALLTSAVIVPKTTSTTTTTTTTTKPSAEFDSIAYMPSHDLLEILTEYIEALPSVAISIHRFHHRHKKALKNLRHAVQGCARKEE